jgi:hypothetical protein
MLEMYPREKTSEKEKENETDHHCKDFFETYQDMPFRSELNEEFLNYREGLEIYKKESAHDLLDLDSIYRTRTLVECTIALPDKESIELDQVHADIAPTDQKITKMFTAD